MSSSNDLSAFYRFQCSHHGYMHGGSRTTDLVSDWRDRCDFSSERVQARKRDGDGAERLTRIVSRYIDNFFGGSDASRLGFANASSSSAKGFVLHSGMSRYLIRNRQVCVVFALHENGELQEQSRRRCSRRQAGRSGEEKGSGGMRAHHMSCEVRKTTRLPSRWYRSRRFQS